MKKRNLLLLPLFALLIAGCKPTASSEEPSTTSAPPVTTSEPVVTSEPPVTTSEPVVTTEEPSVTSEEDEESLPSVPVSEVPAAVVATIAELRGMTDGSSATPAQKEVKYQVTGTVTSVERNANISGVGPGWNLTIQTGGDAIMLYGITEADYAAKWSAVKVGDLLTATGHLAPYGGLHELGRVDYVSHVAGTPVVPEVLTDISQAALVGKDSKLVTIEGLKLHGVRSLYAYMGATRAEISVNLDLRKGDVAIGTYMHYNIPMAQAEAVVALLETVTSNSTIKWTGILTIGQGAFQMTNARVEEWDIVVGDPVVLSGLSFADTTKEIAHDEVYSPKLVVTPFDANVTGLVWASSAPAVATVDQEGKVTPVGPGTTDITATLGAIEAKVVVTVKAAPVGDPTEFVVKPVRDTLATDKNAELTTPELVAKHISGLPVGTTVTASKVYVGVGGGSSSTDSMPDTYTVIKFGTSSVVGNMTITLPAEKLIESVTVKGRGWNTDVAALAINTVSKDFTNPVASNKEDIRTFEYALPAATNVLEFVSTKRVILTEITLTLKVEEVEPPVGPVENFASLPVGHTSIADIVAAPVVGTSYTTRGVILGTNGGAFYMQDPLSGASLGGFGLTNDQKPLLKPGTVIDVTGSYAVNNNGGQLATLTALSVVAEENLSKVTPAIASSAAEFAAMKAETDLKKHARLVKLVGVKVTSVAADNKKFSIDLGGEIAEIAVNFMDSMDAIQKNRPQIGDLARQLLADQTLVDVYAIQQATSTAGTWSFSLGTIDYIVVPVA